MFGQNDHTPWMLWLPHIRALIYLIAVSVFLLINWGETRLMVQFIWTTYFSDQHGLGPDAMYVHADYAVFKIGRNMGRLFVCMGPAFLINKGLSALLPFIDIDEYALYRREKSIERRVKRLSQIEHTLDIAEKLASHTNTVANEVNRLTEKIVKLRIEIDSLELKKKAKIKAVETTGQDLFTQSKARNSTQTKPPRFWRGKDIQPPEF